MWVFGPLGSTTATATATTATATTGFTEIWVGDWDGGDRYTDPHKFWRTDEERLANILRNCAHI